MDKIQLQWRGPHPWPFLTKQPHAEDYRLSGGIYLFTVEHEAGFLIYCAGYTTQQFRRRLKQHDTHYRSGVYTIFDLKSFQQGARHKVWPGFWMKKPRSPSLVAEYDRRLSEIRAATNIWLDGYRVFIAPVPASRRTLMRIEAGIMNSLYEAAPPARDVPDRGMSLSPRWPSEDPLLVINRTSSSLLGMPEQIIV
jgi:hypothetical protein